MMSEARTKWHDALASTRQPGVAHARALEPKAYAWLYRNDRSWLQSQNKKIVPPARGNHSNVDWAKRDSELAREVQIAAIDLAKDHPPLQLTLTAICRRVRGLRCKLRRLEKLPMTARALHGISSQYT